MSNQPPFPEDDARQRDDLDAFLDGLTHSHSIPSAYLDPTLAATVRHVHALASESVAADIRRASKAQRWEDLLQNRIARSTVRPFPMAATLPRSSAPPPIPLRPAIQRSRLRRLGGQSLGLVATLTLILLVAASSLAVFLTVPQGDGDPTMLPAAYGARPEATPVPTGMAPGLVHPILTVCRIQPRTIDETMRVLASPRIGDDGRAELPEAFQDTTTQTSARVATLYPILLPDGPTPEAATVRAVTEVFGQYLSCTAMQSLLGVAATLTDEGLILNYWLGGEPSGSQLLRLAQAFEPSAEARSRIGQPSRDALWGYRKLEDGRIAALILAQGDADLGLLPTTQDFVVFKQVDGQWLIDEIRGPSRG